MCEYRCAKKGFSKIFILKGKNGVSSTFMFLRFSTPQNKIQSSECTQTFFMQIPKNQFLHFSKFEFQGAERVDFKGLKQRTCDIHVFEIFSAAK